MPGCGGGAEGGKMGEALWLLRFSGTVKQEGRKEEGTWGVGVGGTIPESWRLIVKCLEIP